MRRVALTLVVGASAVLAGCAAGPNAVVSPTEAAIFDRAQQPADLLPEAGGVYNPETSRYVGEDGAGNRYWAAKDDSIVKCIVYQPAGQPQDYFNFCGGLSVSATTAEGIVVEFAASPSRLDAASAELIGDTLLVQRP